MKAVSPIRLPVIGTSLVRPNCLSDPLTPSPSPKGEREVYFAMAREIFRHALRIVRAGSFVGLFLASAARAQELPPATQAMLSSLGLAPAILDGLDAELALPPALVEGAKREGKFRVSGTWDPDQFEIVMRIFRGRYPGLRGEYTYASYANRALRVLTAFRQGRVLFEVMTGFGGAASQFKESKALLSLAALPSIATVAADHMRDPDGFWVGHQMTHWCLPYGTQQVAEAELPRSWDDLVAGTRWGNGAIGLANRPQLWLLPLWEAKGAAWGNAFLARLFALKPQLRTENVYATIGLVTLGEFQLALPGSGYRTRLEADKGAPVAFHCPAPVPVAIEEIGALSNSAAPDAARLFINWLLSKEGQIAQFLADRGTPVHRDLQDSRFVSYAEHIQGKPIALRTPEGIERYEAEVAEAWGKYWK
jgi:iron(III) transport system substrate-binding protein